MQHAFIPCSAGKEQLPLYEGNTTYHCSGEAGVDQRPRQEPYIGPKGLGRDGNMAVLAHFSQNHINVHSAWSYQFKETTAHARPGAKPWTRTAGGDAMPSSGKDSTAQCRSSKSSKLIQTKNQTTSQQEAPTGGGQAMALTCGLRSPLSRTARSTACQ